MNEKAVINSIGNARNLRAAAVEKILKNAFVIQNIETKVMDLEYINLLVKPFNILKHVNPHTKSIFIMPDRNG